MDLHELAAFLTSRRDRIRPADERDHLFRLAGHPAPPSHGPFGHVYRWFTAPKARALCPAEDAGKHSRAFVAVLRAVSARRSGETDVSDVVTQLRRRSEEFRQV